MTEPAQGEIWWVQFDPVVGAEIRKTRPAVIMSRPSETRLSLHLVVPVTTWQPRFDRHRSKVQILPTSSNGLANISAADAMQIRSVSSHRLQSIVGVLEENLLEQIRTAVAFATSKPS